MLCDRITWTREHGERNSLAFFVFLSCSFLVVGAGIGATPRAAAIKRTVPAAPREPYSFVLKHVENFDGSALKPKLWRRIEGKSDSGADWQRNISPRADLAVVEGGHLVLRGVKNDDLAADSRRVLAGGVSTRGLFNMMYGKVEVRALLKAQKGAWPAIWLMPQSPQVPWPDCGEIDIIERLNFDPFVYHSVHSAWTKDHPNDPPHSVKGAIKPNDWNIFALEWTPDSLVWRVNGSVTHTYRRSGTTRERWPWDAPFYLMIDMQLGGKWVGAVDESTLPTEMRIDWVKFYALQSGRKRISVFSRP